MSNSLLLEGALLLGAGLACVLLFRRLGLGAVLGYLLAGVLLGPWGLGLVDGGASKLAIAEIGIALLLFLVGLELSPDRLWKLRHNILGLGLLQVILCGLALSALVFLSNFTPAAALALGLPLALSSTAQVLPSLKSSGRINTPFGERAFSILLLQDLAIVPLITIIAALSRAPADPAAPTGGEMALYTILAVAGLVLAGRFILNPLLRLIGRMGERELFVAVGLFTVFASAALMHALHLSAALGTFVAGVMLADSPYRHEIETDIEPFRSILLGLFFIAVGMVLDLGSIQESPLYILAMALGVIAIKTAIIAGLARAFGTPVRQALGLGLLLSQGGEFGFVLFSQAQAAMLIEPQAASQFSAIVTISMALTPFLLMLVRRFEFPAAPASLPDGPEAAPRATAIIIGFGRFGQIVAQLLMRYGVSVTLIDVKPAQIELSGTFGAKVWYGDGRRIDLLRKAGADQASLIAYCTDDRTLAPADLLPVRQAFPDAGLLVRAYDRRQLISLQPLGEGVAIREVYESAIRMGIEALLSLGASEDDVASVEADYRDRDARRLAAQIDSGDLHALKDIYYRPEDWK